MRGIKRSYAGEVLSSRLDGMGKPDLNGPVDSIAGNNALIEVYEKGEPAEQGQQPLWCIPCRLAWGTAC